MELREYIPILRRRWWIPLLLPALVALLSLTQQQTQPEPTITYNAQIRLLIGVVPLEDADIGGYDPRYFAWLISEYLVDDFTQVVSSNLFAANISKRLTTAVEIPAGLIEGSANAGKEHRIITLDFEWDDREEALAIAQAAADELLENSAFYFTQFGTEEAIISIIDTPSVTETVEEPPSRFELPFRLVLGFLVGVGLIFLLEYLDTSIRERRELEEMGFAILGEIPRR